MTRKQQQQLCVGRLGPETRRDLQRERERDYNALASQRV